MDDSAAREEVRSLLASGLVTEVFPRADSQDDALAITARLRGADGLRQKLVIAGFTLETIVYAGIEQPCSTCMYFLVHRRYCELSELKLPVEPEWSCRLWRM